jgi:hypothetical protein
MKKNNIQIPRIVNLQSFLCPFQPFIRNDPLGKRDLLGWLVEVALGVSKYQCKHTLTDFLLHGRLLKDIGKDRIKRSQDGRGTRDLQHEVHSRLPTITHL